jgi:hypothetical protein
MKLKDANKDVTITFRVKRKKSDSDSTYRDVVGAKISNTKIAICIIAHVIDGEVGRVNISLLEPLFVTVNEDFQVSHLDCKAVYHIGGLNI